MLQSASRLLHLAGKCSRASVQLPSTAHVTSSTGVAAGRHGITGQATCCSTLREQSSAGLASCAVSRAAKHTAQGLGTAATRAAQLHCATASATATSARSSPMLSMAAGAVQHVRAALRPAAQVLTAELRAVFQPEHVLQHARTVHAAGSSGAGAAACRKVLARGVTTAAPQTAGPQSEAALQHAAVRQLQPTHARTSTTAAAGCLGKQQLRGAVTSSRMLSPAAGPAQRQGSKTAAAASRQQARAYNGYRASHQSPYASVMLSRGMNPMHALYGVIGVNVAVFLLWQVNPHFAANNFMVSPQHIRDGRVYTLLTSAFSHAELSHLAVNMITLYFFGQEIALLAGPQLFLGLYCTAGIAASLAHVGWYWYKAVSEGGPGYMKDARLRRCPPALGASGAVSAIVIADVLLNPWRMVLVFPIPIPLPAALLGVFWVASDISGSIRGTGTVGHVAHLGGAATGAAFYWAWRRGLLRRRW